MTFLRQFLQLIRPSSYLLIAFGIASLSAAEPKANESGVKAPAEPSKTAPFQSVGFLPLPPGIELGAVSAVAIDSRDQVYVLQRGTPAILAWDAQGKYTHGWGEKLFKTPHGLRIDRQGQLWTTDNALHNLRVFTARGELVRTIDKLELPDGKPTALKAPDDLVFDRQGNIYVADSGNGRIVKLDPTGKLLMTWGKKGKADGEFATAHSLAIDDQDRVYVGDRGNKRIQQFDNNGKHLASWTGFGDTFGMAIRDRLLIASDGDGHQLRQLDLTGKILSVWGDKEQLQLPHLMDFDSRGRLYVAEVNGKRVQIFAPQPQP